jgi:hypothetical protein
MKFTAIYIKAATSVFAVLFDLSEGVAATSYTEFSTCFIDTAD